jgi:CRISPR/Cas system endoribonuclease Cas6 (RAMP superfamily)
MMQAWIGLQQRHLGEASRSLSGIQMSVHESEIARSVLFWQEQYKEQALNRFASAIGSQPEWQNPKWVQTLYSPLVAESVEQMQKETERRKTTIVVSR